MELILNVVWGGREREREREREIGYAWDEQEATYYFKHGTNCHTPY